MPCFHGASQRTHSFAFVMATSALCAPAAFAQQANSVELPTVDVTAAAANTPLATPVDAEAALNTTPQTLYQTPLGQVQTTVPEDRMINTQAFSVFDILQSSPGIQVKQGNGPRDVGVSIRGSNAQNGFGIRNILVFEDGFPVTQPDGLSRTDITDPHAYGAINVIRGPSSALYGNFATGGMINFQLRTPAQIGGVETGTDAGTFGYLNNYLAYGTAGKDYSVSLFTSNVIGNGPTNFNLFNTQTVNALASYSPTPDDTLTLKMIGNRLETQLPLRLTLNQFYQNPYQTGCYAFPSLSAAKSLGCPTLTLFKNGFGSGGGRFAATAYQAGLGRDDTRDILSLRWEHNFDIATVWRTQIVADDKNIDQPTGATTARGDEPSINLMSDVTSHGTLFGFEAVHFLGINFNRDYVTNYTNNVVLGGDALFSSIGAITRSAPRRPRTRESVPAKKLNSRITYLALPDLATNIPILWARLIISPIQPPVFPHWPRLRLPPTTITTISPRGFARLSSKFRMARQSPDRNWIWYTAGEQSLRHIEWPCGRQFATQIADQSRLRSLNDVDAARYGAAYCRRLL